MATIKGTNASETIDAADGVTNDGDSIFGYGGEDTIFGLGGNDFLKGGGGGDTIDGGEGIDMASYADSAAGVTIDLMHDIAFGGDADGDNLNSIESVAGSAHADTLSGDHNANTLIGLNGNDALMGFGGKDMLYGNDGDDDLYGGAGDDTMDGGAGNDDFYVGSANDIVIEKAANVGYDRVITQVSYTLAAGVSVEGLQTDSAGATTAINLTGNEIANNITGNNGANWIDGGGGIDKMSGLAGDDWYFVDNQKDVVTDAIGQGALDRVFTSASYALGAGAEIEKLSTTDHMGLAAIDLIGNALDNEVYGNAGSNGIDGKAGNDLLTGMGGADKFYFSTSLDPASNVDQITDFDVADDMICVATWILANPQVCILLGLQPGALDPAYFHIGEAAADANDHMIYNDVTGALSFDADGNDPGAAVQFATLDPGLALTSANFFLF